MFNAKKWFAKDITVCVDKGKYSEVNHIIDTCINTEGAHNIYADIDKDYIAFKTRTSVSDVSKTLEKYLHGSNTRIIGNTIFVKFEERP